MLATAGVYSTHHVSIANNSRDNLILNILMLTFPIDAIKQWQMVH
jgi:hypothetical protein